MLLPTQTVEVQAQLQHAFTELLTGVQSSLEPGPRDKFTQNLAALKAGIGKVVRRPDM